MSCTPHHVILLDGAFLIKKLQSSLGRFPSASDIQAVATTISNHAFVSGHSCLRIYFYHARPAAQTLFNPISKRTLALRSTQIHTDHARLLQELEQTPDFALRLGETNVTGWKVGDSALRHLVRSARPLQADDLVPAIEQKGVDLLRAARGTASCSLPSRARNQAGAAHTCRSSHGDRSALALT